MHIYLFFFACILISSCATKNEDFEYLTEFESSNGLATSTYEELMRFYKKADAASSLLSMSQQGITDSGEALHLLHARPINPTKNNLKILIINGIHPGEPDGIDASMLLVKDLINNTYTLPNNIELFILPVYNIGGAMNRNKTTRANQNGPEEYGFRGNALNYDLNRDFIKSDTQNSKAFYQLYHQINPDIFIDTHVSNGADYQYTLTHLFTQAQQLGGELGTYTTEQFIPKLESNLTPKNLPITPYVNVFNQSPEVGFAQFLDTPRYSTGYTRLWNSLGLMIETHMMKPYNERVEATLSMLKSLVDVSADEAETIQLKRASNFEYYKNAEQYHFNYVLDSTAYTSFDFLGYKATQEKSKVTGKNRLKYHTDQPHIFPVKYYNKYAPTTSLEIPQYYLIPKAHQKIITLMELNNVQMKRVIQDSILTAEVYHIKDYKTLTAPYEGHYLHYETKLTSSIEQVHISAGDVLINTQQDAVLYLLETLEPQAVDSFFNWNFFDTILQQKEGFSPYVFEDIAEAMLKNDSSLRQEFEELKKTDTVFGNQTYRQLNWLYKRSPHYEKAHLRYPIYRILK